MVGDVLVEVFDEVSVSVDVQRFEIPHYVVKQAILGEKLCDSSAAEVLGAPVALDAVYQEFYTNFMGYYAESPHSRPSVRQSSAGGHERRAEPQKRRLAVRVAVGLRPRQVVVAVVLPARANAHVREIAIFVKPCDKHTIRLDCRNAILISQHACINALSKRIGEHRRRACLVVAFRIVDYLPP